MLRRALSGVAFMIAAGLPAVVSGQATTLYHLHKELSAINTANRQLKTPVTDATQTALQSANLKASLGSFASWIANFETQSGVPNRSGVIPAGSTVSLVLRMKVTRLPSSGSINPYVILTLNAANGPFVCSRGQGQDGLPALTTTLTPYSFTCTTSAAVTMTTSARFFLQVGVWVASPSGTGNQNLFAELDIETNADSTATIPNPGPNITSLSAASGVVGDSITLNGTDFGSTGTLTFNGTTAATSSWTSTAIQATVPAAVPLGSGPVVVTVGGVPSNGVAFTALPRITGITPSAAARGEPVTIAGTTFGTTTGTVTFATNVPATTDLRMDRHKHHRGRAAGGGHRSGHGIGWREHERRLSLHGDHHRHPFGRHHARDRRGRAGRRDCAGGAGGRRQGDRGERRQRDVLDPESRRRHLRRAGVGVWIFE